MSFVVIRACIVAFTTLTGLGEPRDLARIFSTPAISKTILTPPPAIMPVPGEAGFSKTLAAPNLPITWWKIVPSTNGIETIPFFATSVAFLIDSESSLALPNPTPTRPFLSPTATKALKLNRRPPLTTLATRLIWITPSFNSGSVVFCN